MLSMTARPPSNLPLQIPVYPGKFPSQPIDHALARLKPEQQARITRTRAGIFLIFVGIIFQPIPTLALYAGLAILAGVVLIFLGRRALGPRHQRYALRSFILVIVGQATTFVGTFVVIILFGLAVSNGTTDLVSALSTLFLSLYLVIVIGDVVTTLGIVFLTYDLQDSTGRALLWSAFSLEVLVNVIIAFAVVSEVQATAQQVLSQVASAKDALFSLQYRFAYLRLLLWIAAIPYAIAYFKAWARIDKIAVAAETSPAITA